MQEHPDHGPFLEHLDPIERAIEHASARAGWFGADADDFRSWVFVKLLECDSRIMRQFSGRSTIETYLAVVVTNLMRDFRNARFGRWRPSAVAERLGEEAVMLDRLLNRDRVPLETAVRSLVHGSACDRSEPELRRLAARIPRRTRRAFVGPEAIERIEGGVEADHKLRRVERKAAATRVGSALEESLAELDSEDQVILRLRFWNGLTVADVARSLGLRQKPLYRRIARCLADLASDLQRRGVDAGMVSELIGATGD